MSSAEDQTFVHYRSDGEGHVHRVGERAEPVDTLKFDEQVTHPSFGESGGFTRIQSIEGRWPDEVFMRVDYDSREFVAERLFRFKEGKWTHVNLLGMYSNHHDAWPWYDRSILALAFNDRGPRLGLELR